MEHTPGFLMAVDDAKSRIRQIDIDGYKRLLASGEKHLLIDVREDREFDKKHAAGAMHLGKGIIERDVERTVPDKGTKMVLIAEADSARRWLPTPYRKWATRT